MLQRLAAEQDAELVGDTEPADDVPYEPGLQAELAEHGPQAMRDFNQIVVRGTTDPKRYNSALWYAYAHDLAWENRPDLDCVILTWHEGKEPHDLG